MKDELKTQSELISEVKMLREQVAELTPLTEKSMMSLLDIIGEGIRIIDTDFKIIYENQIHRDLLGTHVGEYCFKAYQNNNEICEGCTVAMSFKDGKIHKEVRSIQTDKGVRLVELTTSSARNFFGKMIAGIEIVRDITERKQMEEKQEKLINELQEALKKIKTLKSLIPICAWCKKALNDEGYWENLENYIREHSDSDFTHGICPECLKKVDSEISEEFLEHSDNEKE